MAWAGEPQAGPYDSLSGPPACPIFYYIPLELELWIEIQISSTTLSLSKHMGYLDDYIPKCADSGKAIPGTDWSGMKYLRFFSVFFLLRGETIL